MGFDPFKCGTVSGFPTLIAGDEACQSSIDQTQKIALSLTSIAGFGSDELAPATYIGTQAAWTAKITSGLRLTPFVENFIITAGDIQEEANENNLNGIPQYLGNAFSKVEFTFKNTNSALIAKLEQITSLTSKTAGTTLVKAYFLGRNSRVTAKANADGIPIYNFVIKDVSTEGRNKPNTYMAQFYLAEDWSKDMNTFDANFDPIASLANPSA